MMEIQSGDEVSDHQRANQMHWFVQLSEATRINTPQDL
jgi:hypothetical protein